MKWSRPVGLLLTTLCMVYSMPPQTTTTRYTSLEGYNRFSLNPIRNFDKNISLSLPTTNISSYISDLTLISNNMNLTRQIRTAKQPKDDDFYNDMLNISKSNNINDNTEISRKLKRNPTKTQTLYSNFFTNIFGNDPPSNKTLKVNTVNKVSTKVNKHVNRVATKPVFSKVRVPDSKKNSSVVLNIKNGVNVVTTKAPFRLKVSKVTRTTTKSPKIVHKTTTSVPLVIKLTKFTTTKPKISTTLRHASKQTGRPHTIKLSRPNVKNSTSGTKPKQKPTIHKIITKWSDSTDLSEVKQNWYEDGVPYPNPNPEISSFSPPVSIGDVSSISPIISDFNDNFNYPNPNPEISSFSPPVSISDVSSITPIISDFSDNFNYPNPNPEISSFSPPISLSDVSSISPGFSENDYLSPNPEISSFSPPFSLDEQSFESQSDEYVDDAYYPNPRPEISSYSPSYSINDVPSISDIADIPDSPSPTPSTSAASNPISVFNLDMIPDQTKQAGTGGGSPCPTVHISSSVLSSRQMECSDLNLVINSHFHQNQNGGGTRNPAISAYDAAQEAAVAPIQQDVPLAGETLGDPGVANSGAALSDPGAGTAEAAVPQAAAPQAPAAAAPSGGTGGSGGSGGDGNNGGGIKLPDLKNMFDAIMYICSKLGKLLSFLRNPYLYIIPIALFFALGFFTVLALFPWWIPLLLLYLGVKSHKTPKETVTFHKHVHKPIHHPDGWFWNHQTKTWQNVQDFAHKRNDQGDKRIDNYEDIINKLKHKYEDNKSIVQTWKRRKRPK